MLFSSGDFARCCEFAAGDSSDAAQPGHAEEPLLRPARWPESAPPRATGAANAAATADPDERPNHGEPWDGRHRQQQHVNAEPPARGPGRRAGGRSHRATGRRAGRLGGRCGAVGGPARLQQLLRWLLKGQTGGEVLPHQLHGEWLQDARVQDLLPGTGTRKSKENVYINVKMLFFCH